MQRGCLQSICDTLFNETVTPVVCCTQYPLHLWNFWSYSKFVLKTHLHVHAYFLQCQFDQNSMSWLSKILCCLCRHKFLLSEQNCQIIAMMNAIRSQISTESCLWNYANSCTKWPSFCWWYYQVIKKPFLKIFIFWKKSYWSGFL